MLNTEMIGTGFKKTAFRLFIFQFGKMIFPSFGNFLPKEPLTLKTASYLKLNN